MAALSHREPDRVPIDLASTIDSSIVIEGYERLKQALGIEGENVLSNRMMRVVHVDERILEALDVDARELRLFGEESSQYRFVDEAQVDERAAQPLAGVCLLLERNAQLDFVDEIGIEQQVSQALWCVFRHSGFLHNKAGF